MQKFLFDVFQIIIVAKIGYSILKWAIKGTKSRKKSIVSKIMKLVSNKIHYHLDNALKKQRKVLYPKNTSSKVIPIKKTQ